MEEKQKTGRKKRMISRREEKDRKQGRGKKKGQRQAKHRKE